MRDSFLQYGRQSVDEEDIASVVEVLKSAWLTTGPQVEAFEAAAAEFVGARAAVAVSSGTAALHAAVNAIGISAGDEVIVPVISFVATANCVVFQGGTPVFADVDINTLLIDPEDVEDRITERTKAIIAMDYAGQPCDYDALRAIADRHGITLVADGCHSLGAEHKGNKVGTLADLTVFSFHPVKHITTGEGGMVVTDDEGWAYKMRRFRNHGIDLDHRRRAEQGSWIYDMVDIGYNYRISDLQCALGQSQLGKLPGWLRRRHEIADQYDRFFATVTGADPLLVADTIRHAYHLYVIKVASDEIGPGRDEVFRGFRAENIGVNVHYMPIHLHSFYQQEYGYRLGDYPVGEAAYEQIISLPMFPLMSDDDVSDVVDAYTTVINRLGR